MVAIGSIAMLVGCVIVWLIGGRAERLGAVALSACWLTSLAFQSFSGAPSDVPLAVADGLYAAALFALAARFDRSWIWVSLVLQFADLSGHAMLLLLQGEDRLACVAFINVSSFGVLLALVFGAALHAYEARRGGRARRRTPGAPGPRRSRA